MVSPVGEIFFTIVIFLREIPDTRHPIFGKTDTSALLKAPPDPRGGPRPAGVVAAALEWFIKLFLGVHFADNLA